MLVVWYLQVYATLEENGFIRAIKQTLWEEGNSLGQADEKCPALYLNSILDQTHPFHPMVHPRLQIGMPGQ